MQTRFENLVGKRDVEVYAVEITAEDAKRKGGCDFPPGKYVAIMAYRDMEPTSKDRLPPGANAGFPDHPGETLITMLRKSEARAIAAALMGVAAEL